MNTTTTPPFSMQELQTIREHILDGKSEYELAAVLSRSYGEIVDVAISIRRIPEVKKKLREIALHNLQTEARERHRMSMPALQHSVIKTKDPVAFEKPVEGNFPEIIGKVRVTPAKPLKTKPLTDAGFPEKSGEFPANHVKPSKRKSPSVAGDGQQKSREQQAKEERKKQRDLEERREVEKSRQQQNKKFQTRKVDTSEMKYVRVNNKTVIQVPKDKDEQEAIREFNARDGQNILRTKIRYHNF